MRILAHCSASFWRRLALASVWCLAGFRVAAEPLRVSHCVGGLEAEAVSLIAEGFTEGSGIAVRVTAEDDEEMAQRLMARQEPLPGVLITYSEHLPFLADAGCIVPLDDHVSAPLWDDFVAGVLQSVTYRGKRWAIPIEANPYGLFCNLALFRAAGIAQLPTTWEQTLAAAETLTADTDGDGRIDRWGYTQCAFQLPLLFLAYGCDYLNAEGSDAGFNNDAALEALKLYVRLRRLSPSVDFERGDIGMKMSVLDNLARYAHLDYAIVPPPRARAKVNLFGGSAGPLCLAVVAGAQQKHALEFVQFWLWPEISLRWSTSSDNIALRRSVLQSAAYRRYLGEHPRVRALAAELPYCRARPCRRAYREISQALAQVSNQAVELENPTDADLKALLQGAAARVRQALAAEAANHRP